MSCKVRVIRGAEIFELHTKHSEMTEEVKVGKNCWS